MSASRVAVTQTDIQSALRQLGLAGQPVCVHASLRSFGLVTGGAQAVVQAFLAEGCTLMAPTFSYIYSVVPPLDQRVPRNGFPYDQPHPGGANGASLVYTPTSQEIDPDMGAIAAAVLNHPGRVRGNHPLNSFSAVGPQAAKLIAGQAPLAVYVPLEALVAAKGYVLLMGVGLDSMTLVHLAEQRAGRVLFRRWANDHAGHPQMVETGGCSDGFGQLAPVLQPWQRQTRVGESVWQLFPAPPALQAAADAIRAHPEITHCGDLACERCHDALEGGPLVA